MCEWFLDNVFHFNFRNLLSESQEKKCVFIGHIQTFDKWQTFTEFV